MHPVTTQAVAAERARESAPVRPRRAAPARLRRSAYARLFRRSPRGGPGPALLAAARPRAARDQPDPYFGVFAIMLTN